MTHALEERRRRREELVALARAYVDDLAQRITVVAATVAGSVARGDFNVWSDVDVVIVAENLPPRTPERMAVVMEGRFPRVQAVAFTPDEFRAAVKKSNRLVLDAIEHGIPLRGDVAAIVQAAPMKDR
jgi:uncharacterized protein